MTDTIRYFILLFAISALAACSSRPAVQSPAEVEDRVIIDGKVLPLPEGPSIQPQSMSRERPMSPVVRKLMESAGGQRSAGNLDGAADSLERALRIEPRNAMLWSRLADVRFAQKSWQKAIQLAAKSNTLVQSNENLRRQNWYLMANAYEAIGNAASAQKYRDKLNR